MTMRWALVGCGLLLAVPSVAQQLPLRERMLLAEDARAQTDAELAPLARKIHE